MTFEEYRTQLHKQLDATLDRLGDIPGATPITQIVGLTTSQESEIEEVEPPSDPFVILPGTGYGKYWVVTAQIFSVRVDHAPVPLPQPPKREL